MEFMERQGDSKLMKMGLKILATILRFWKSNKRKMDPEPKTFDGYVVRGILANNLYGITEVSDLRLIKSMYLERANYPHIVSLIQDKDLAQLMKMPEGAQHPTFQEYLEIVQFQSQDGQKFVATIYDSIGLWQDPQIVDIFPL